MIIKTLGVKGSSSVYSRLIDYINRDEAAMHSKDGDIYTIRHNTFGTPEQVAQQFRMNEEGRMNTSRRNNNNKLMHIILSLSEKDREHVTPQMLEHLSREFIRLSDPDALYYGTIHMTDSKNPHAHILESSVNMMGTSTRQDKQTFEKLKHDLEIISQEAYSVELVNSRVRHGTHSQEKSDREWQIGNAGRVSRKDEIKQIVAASFELATTREEFFDLLREDNLKTYDRGGETVGIEDINNFRFKTLGIDLAELDVREQRLKELENVSMVKEQQREENEEKELTIEERMKELDELGKEEPLRA